MNATFIVFIMSSCLLANGQSNSEFAHWLASTWKNTAFNHTETWKQEGNTLQGHGLAMEGNDTLFYERLEINLDVNPMVYTSWVKGQNNGSGIKFKLTEATDTSWLFENPQHDFPKKIQYTKIGEAIMYARVSGHENKMPREEHFYFIRKED